MKTIFVDMDGVLTDFVGSVRKAVQWWDKWPEGEYDICKASGYDIWPYTNNFKFWHQMDRTGEAVELMALLEKHNYYVCTAPTFEPQCAAGKLAWLRDNWPHCYRKRRYILTPHKHLLARPDYLLIDDSDAQCSEWTRHGGEALLFARPWNSLHADVYPMIPVIDRLS
jgi:5'(3')-deoxyribonucleotidase